MQHGWQKYERNLKTGISHIFPNLNLVLVFSKIYNIIPVAQKSEGKYAYY